MMQKRSPICRDLPRNVKYPLGFQRAASTVRWIKKSNQSLIIYALAYLFKRLPIYTAHLPYDLGF